MEHVVYIATSIDGYIAGPDGDLDWLQMVPNPDQDDFGFAEFLDGIDALVMGRTTFETVLGFGGEWPYSVPVHVWSRGTVVIPERLKERVSPISGTAAEVSGILEQSGARRIYVDGGRTIQSFLRADRIDELTITTIPIVLGGGTRLFDLLDSPLRFDLVRTRTHLNQLVMSTYRRVRE